LDGTKIGQHRVKDPEAFLSRVSIVGEGATEAGFTAVLLTKALGGPLVQFGVHITDGGGHETTLSLLEALSEGGLSFGGFADDEKGKYPTRWKTLADKLDKLLFRWTSGCLDENIINLIPEDKLELLIQDPAETKTGFRLRTLADRLGTDDKTFVELKAKAGADLRKIIIEAALGTVPVGKEAEKKKFQSHAQTWFKTFQGGEELANKMFALEQWPTLRPQLLPFCNAVRASIDLFEITDIAP